MGTEGQGHQSLSTPFTLKGQKRLDGKKLAIFSVNVATIPGKVQHQRRYAYSVLLILSYLSHDGWLASSIFSHYFFPRFADLVLQILNHYFKWLDDIHDSLVIIT